MTGRETLRDKFGDLIGTIETNVSRHTLGDKASNLRGSYDAHDDWTRDKSGSPVGRGNLLTTLLK